MKTILCERLGIELPIIQAPMGGAVGPALAAAVSNAGGLGMLVLWRADADTMRRQIREMRALTSRPSGVNLNLDFPQEERLEICLEERVPIISFFWRDPSSLVPRAKAGGAIVMHTVGSAIDAKRAVDCGVDIVIAQGWEAGGGRRWDSRRARPRCSPGARRGGRLDRHALSRQRRGGDPSALSGTASAGERGRHGFSGESVRHSLAERAPSHPEKSNGSELGGGGPAAFRRSSGRGRCDRQF